MGFGLTFLGFFFMLFIPLGSVGLLPDLSVIGCIIMFFGLRRLISYCTDCPQFICAKRILYILFLFCGADLVLGFFTKNAAISLTGEIVGVLLSLTLSAFSIALFLGIFKLSASVELPRLSTRARRMISVAAVYGFISSISGIFRLCFDGSEALASTTLALIHYIDLAAYIFEHVFLFLSLALIFTCYMRICLEGDEDMSPKQKTDK